jgi:hypothetical protein
MKMAENGASEVATGDGLPFSDRGLGPREGLGFFKKPSLFGIRTGLKTSQGAGERCFRSGL